MESLKSTKEYCMYKCVTLQFEWMEQRGSKVYKTFGIYESHVTLPSLAGSDAFS